MDQLEHVIWVLWHLESMTPPSTRCEPSRDNQFELLEPPDPIFGAEPLPIVAEPRLSRAEHLLIGP